MPCGDDDASDDASYGLPDWLPVPPSQAMPRAQPSTLPARQQQATPPGQTPASPPERSQTAPQSKLNQYASYPSPLSVPLYSPFSDHSSLLTFMLTPCHPGLGLK